MAKINYSNFKEDECDIIPTESVEVLPTNTSYDLSNNSSYGNGQALASAVSPIAAITNCINIGLDTVSTISKCIAIVSIEKQKTEQVKVAMNAQIKESKQQTERVRIHEKEKTMRLIVTCESNLKIKKLELEKLRDEYKFKGKERKLLHKEYLEALNILEKNAEDLMEEKNILRGALKDVILEKGDPSLIEIYLHGLNDLNTKLVEFSEQIVSLKGMR